MGTLFINSNFAILKWDFAHGFQIFIYYITNVIIGYYHGEITRLVLYKSYPLLTYCNQNNCNSLAKTHNKRRPCYVKWFFPRALFFRSVSHIRFHQNQWHGKVVKRRNVMSARHWSVAKTNQAKTINNINVVHDVLRYLFIAYRRNKC